MHTNTTNTVSQPPTQLLTEAEQAWLDGCPVGDARSLTSCGRTVTVDRRINWGAPVQVPTFTIEPRWEVNLPGNPTWDSTGNPPIREATITSADPVDISGQQVGSFVPVFRISSETITALT